jgi:hypothetical protein
VETKICEYCGDIIFRKKNDRSSHWEKRKYCNYSCSTTQRNRNKDPFHLDPVSRCKFLLTRTKTNEKGCLIWLGSKNKQGYGSAIVSGKVRRVHRVIYEYLVCDVPENMDVCHSCDNPSCINPEHLFLGTVSDNMQDMLRKGRAKFWGKVPLDPLLKEEVRKSVVRGTPKKVIANELKISLQSVYNLCVNL